MLTLFKNTQATKLSQKVLLEDSELHNLRDLAEHIDCSATPNQILESHEAGNLPTRALGSGLDYAESRVYQMGDDPRAINWRLSARSQETFVKTYHIESRPSVSIFLDKRRSMFFGTRRRLKVTQALRVATLIAYAADLHQLDFQAWILDEEFGLQYFDDIEAFLSQANHAINNTRTNNKSTINSVLQEINQRTTKGSLVYLISDFIDLEKVHQSPLSHLYERCFVQAIHLFDKAELNLPSIGRLRLQALHHSKSYRIDTQKEKEQYAFTQIVQKHFDHKKSIIRSLAIPYYPLATDAENIQQIISLPLGQP